MAELSIQCQWVSASLIFWKGALWQFPYFPGICCTLLYIIYWILSFSLLVQGGGANHKTILQTCQQSSISGGPV